MIMRNNKPYFLQEACNLSYPYFTIVCGKDGEECIFSVTGLGDLTVSYFIGGEEYKETYNITDEVTVAVTITDTGGNKMRINLYGNNIESVTIVEQTKAVEVNKNSTLRGMSINSSFSEYADVRNCKKLNAFDCQGTSIESVNLTKNKILNEIFASEIDKLDINDCQNLSHVSFAPAPGATQIPAPSAITISGKTFIGEIRFAGNGASNEDDIKKTIIALIESSIRIGSVDFGEATISETLREEIESIVGNYGWTAYF